jgi:hypothetical protein
MGNEKQGAGDAQDVQTVRKIEALTEAVHLFSP